MSLKDRPWFDALLAWYFVTVWGSGFLATKVGLQHAAPFTFLTLRFAFGIACVIPIVLLMQPLITALIAVRWLGETLAPRQWAGVIIGLAGVALVTVRTLLPARGEPS
jgi:drug/metabolite transporter (DMT)-like permease